MVNVRLNAIEITRVKLCLACSRASALGYDASRDTRLGFRDRPSARASRIRLERAWWNERLTARLDLPRL